MPIYRDEAGRAPSSRALRIRGLIVAVVVGVASTALYQLGTGTYDDTFKLTVVANSTGEGLAPGAEVKFRGLDIGSVKTLQSVGYNKQKMTVELDPRQAKALGADTKAQFTSSNVFGTAAVELVSDGQGPRLTPNQTLVIGTDVQAASITGLLRQGQKLGRIIDSPDVNHIFEVLRRHADLAEPVTKAFFDFTKILFDAQTVPFSRSLSVFASIVNGLNDSIPLFGLVTNLLDGLTFLVEPVGVDRANRILRQTGKLLDDSGHVVARNIDWIVRLTNALIDIYEPITFAVGSLAPAYDRLSGLLDRTSAAFPVIDGKARMQIEVILDTVPGLATALPPAPGTPATGGGR